MARLLEPNHGVQPPLVQMSISPARHQCSYIRLHQIRTSPETLSKPWLWWGAFIFFCVWIKHISLLFRCLICSEQNGTCTPWDDGGLCLIDALRAFGGIFLHGVWRFMCSFGLFGICPSQYLDWGWCFLSRGATLCWLFALLQGSVKRGVDWETPR